MSSSWRTFGSAVGFGFGVVWMTVGVGSAILVLLCAAFGYGVAFVAEHERANLGRLRPTSRKPADDEPLVFDEFELPRYALEEEELAEEAMAPVAAEADYGWPTG